MACRRVLVRSLPLVGVLFVLGCPEPTPQVRRLDMNERNASSPEPRLSERDVASEDQKGVVDSDEDAQSGSRGSAEASEANGKGARESSR
jgi:hypothetical protein